jgi:stress response protein YsnF
MVDPEAVGHLVGAPVHDDAGTGLGRVTAVYLDDATGRPEWVAVRAGPLDPQDRLVPLVGASLGAYGELWVGVGKGLVDTAPEVATWLRQLSAADENLLYRHYDRPPDAGERRNGTEGTGNERTPDERTRNEGIRDEGPDEGPGTEGTDDAMTRSAERLRIRRIPGSTGRARLRKYTVTEYVTVTVPVAREDVRIEHELPEPPREPGSAGTTDPTAAADPATTTAPAEGTTGDGDETPDLVLYAERPVVTTEQVPVERVRLSKQPVAEEQRVTAEVHRERIAAESDVDALGPPD